MVFLCSSATADYVSSADEIGPLRITDRSFCVGMMNMSFVTAVPELVESAAQDLAGIRSALVEAAQAVAVPTTALAAAGEDEVSAAIAALFGTFGQEYQGSGVFD